MVNHRRGGYIFGKMEKGIGRVFYVNNMVRGGGGFSMWEVALEWSSLRTFINNETNVHVIEALEGQVRYHAKKKSCNSCRKTATARLIQISNSNNYL